MARPTTTPKAVCRASATFRSNGRGRAQASAIGRALRKAMPDAIAALEAAEAFIASPLIRTRQTMELARAALGLAPSRYALEPALKELTFGEWEGLTWPQVVEARSGRRAGARGRQVEFRPARRRELRDARRAAAAVARIRATPIASSSRTAASPAR